MSLRVRLSLILGSAFVIIWALAAAWMLRDLRQQMMFSLDQRLVASARMVAGLIDQLPQPLAAKGEEAHFSADQLSVPDGMACQVSSLRGEILARSHTLKEQAPLPEGSAQADCKQWQAQVRQARRADHHLVQLAGFGMHAEFLLAHVRTPSLKG